MVVTASTQESTQEHGTKPNSTSSRRYNPPSNDSPDVPASHNIDFGKLGDDEDGVGKPKPTTPINETAPLNNGWAQWAHKKLKLAGNTKDAATKKATRFIKKHFAGTKMIFVVGQSGTGKSTILRELTGLDLKIGSTMASGTTQYEICPAILDGEQYLFIDTPGFGAGDMDNVDTFEDIMACLQALGPFVNVVGLMFVFGCPEARLRVEDLRTIQWVQCFCGPAFFHNITFVTNKWDTLSEDGLEEAWRRVPELLSNREVQQILSPPGNYRGGAVYHHGFPGGQGSIHSHPAMSKKREEGKRGDELRNLIRRRYANSEPGQLQVTREVMSGTPRLKTEAARILDANPVTTKIHIEQDRAVMFPPPPPPRQLQHPSVWEPEDEVLIRTWPSPAPRSHDTPPPSPVHDEGGSSTWYEKVAFWIGVGVQAAIFFLIGSFRF